MRITRYPSISEEQFFGCVSAFVDSLMGELNAALASLRRLENKAKGDSFAYEMTLDTHRYGALIVLDRWATVAGTFGPHLELTHDREILVSAPERVQAAEFILTRTNGLLDAAETYSPAVVEACVAAFQALRITFSQELQAADRASKLGPMLPAGYTEARRIFLEDLAAR